jgi:hypothetical protein
MRLPKESAQDTSEGGHLHDVAVRADDSFH